LKLTEDQVRYVSDLANLELTKEEVTRMSHELGEILTYIEQLNEVDTAHVAPMAEALYEADEIATLREDVLRQPMSNQEVLANAPLAGNGYFKVPKVIER
jgi:aspartyl-tRNA(Asn)/glutamyl-tRNA(Gln) amidotransferase subunit C